MNFLEERILKDGIGIAIEKGFQVAGGFISFKNLDGGIALAAPSFFALSPASSTYRKVSSFFALVIPT